MYICECGAILKKVGAQEGICPNCSSTRLKEKMLCPDCGEEMMGPTEIDIYTTGYHCRNCNIKVYVEGR